jgi:hypothetical protein
MKNNKITKLLASLLILVVATLFTACDDLIGPPIVPPIEQPKKPILPDADQYNVSFTLSGIGSKTVEVSRTFRHAIGNPDSCTESNVTQKFTETLDSIAITRVEGPAVHSQNNNGAASIVAVYSYSDKGKSWWGNCEGNGWIDASFTLFGTQQEKSTLEAIQKAVTLQAGVAGSVTLSYALDQLVGLNSVNWVYSIEITAIKGGITTGSVTLSDAEPSSSQFNSFISSEGQLVLSISE